MIHSEIKKVFQPVEFKEDLAKLSDSPQIVAINKLFHLDVPNFIWDTSEWVTQQILLQNYYAFRNEDQVLGAICIDINSEKSVSSIETIAVREDVQGMGIGKRLLSFAEEFSRLRKCEHLSVDSFCAYGLTGFYEKNGFKCGDVLGCYEGHEYFSFYKKL